MVDSALAILLGVMLVEMARFGGYVSANPPNNPAIAKAYTRRFWIYAIVSVILVMVQGTRIYLASQKAEADQANLNGSIRDLSAQLTRSDTGREVDNAYLKAKLEDAYSANDDLRKFARHNEDGPDQRRIHREAI